MNESSWGGAIEVSILGAFYGIEICVVDINAGMLFASIYEKNYDQENLPAAMINRFGEDKNYAMRGFLLYDGIQ